MTQKSSSKSGLLHKISTLDACNALIEQLEDERLSVLMLGCAGGGKTYILTLFEQFCHDRIYRLQDVLPIPLKPLVVNSLIHNKYLKNLQSIPEAEPTYKNLACSVNPNHRTTTRFRKLGGVCDYGGDHNGILEEENNETKT